MKLQKYKNWLILNEVSSKTIENYIGNVGRFLRFLNDKPITEKNVNEFILYLKEKNKNSSINIYKSSLKSYLKFLKKDIPIPKHSEPKPRVIPAISLEYFEEEVIHTAEGIFKNPLRVKALLYFMFFTGVRKSEIGNLKREHINLDTRIVKIHGKGDKQREVCFSKKVKGILECYFTSENEMINAFNTTSIAIRFIFKKLNEYFKDINFKPHLLRHSFAKHMIRMKAVSSYELKHLMGHKDIKTTELYLSSITIEDIKKNYDQNIK